MRVEIFHPLLKNGVDARNHRRGIQLPVGIAGKLAGRHQHGIDYRVAALRIAAIERLVGCGDDDIAADQGIGFRGSHPRRQQIFSRLRYLDMRVHRAVLLRQAGDVEIGAVVGIEMRSQCQCLADGDYPGAADAGDQDRVRTLDLRKSRLWNRDRAEIERGLVLVFPRGCPADGHQRRTESFQA